MPISYVFLSTERHQSCSTQKKTREIGNSNCFKLGLNEVQMLSCACSNFFETTDGLVVQG